MTQPRFVAVLNRIVRCVAAGVAAMAIVCGLDEVRMNAAPPELVPAPHGDFPPLPPAPDDSDHRPLRPLDEEMWDARGSFLYQPEGDRWGIDEHHKPPLRLPEDWVKPQAVTLFAPFLGTGPIDLRGRWPGPDGYAWEPRFVLAGSYRVFGLAFRENGDDLVALGHQLRLDFDLQLTGTERFHVQWRPIGRRDTGGSYYAFTDPEGYVDNSTAEPDRYWFEGELGSMFGAWLDKNHPWDWTVTVGKVPLPMHNELLINDEVLAVIVNKNNLMPGNVSNLNLQLFYLFNDVDFELEQRGEVLGVHATADHQHAFYEATYAYWRGPGGRDEMHFAGLSRTQFYGAYTLAARALAKFAPDRLDGSGQLFVLEVNRLLAGERHLFGFRPTLAYVNAFAATSGWRSMAGANFNRLDTAFEVNPLIRITAGSAPDDRFGVTGGIQSFRRGQDQSISPEFAVESRAGTVVLGVGLRYQQKLSARTWWELLLVANESDDRRYDRYGALASWFVLW